MPIARSSIAIAEEAFETHSPCWLDLPLTTFNCLFFSRFSSHLHMTPNKSISSPLVEKCSMDDVAPVGSFKASLCIPVHVQ